MYKILGLLVDGAMDSSLALTHDTVFAANRVGSQSAPGERMGLTLFFPNRRRVRTWSGASVRVEPDIGSRRFDALVVPSIGVAGADEIEQRLASPEVQTAIEWLKKNSRRFSLVAASCSAVFVLAEAGLLDGKVATTTWWLAPIFRARYPDVELDETRMVTEAEGVLCAGAALAHMDLMLHLIARAIGPELGGEVARGLAIEQRPCQARYMTLSAITGLDEDVSEIERWISSHLSETFTMGELAKTLGMSTRTLDRRVRAVTGAGPSRLVQRLRVEQAAHLIETTSLPLGEVAERVGYRDPATLRRLLRRDLDSNPSDLRKRAR